MRCPHCHNDNDPGASLCEWCDTPLTAYSGHLTGEASAAALARLARLSVRPPVVPAVIGLDVLVALLGPFGAIVRGYGARTVTNAEGTNYAGAAFSMVHVAFTTLFMLPLGLAILWLAWATWNRATWSWWANAALLAALAVGGLTGTLSQGIVRLLLIVVAAAAAAFWVRPHVRDWFGA